VQHRRVTCVWNSSLYASGSRLMRSCTTNTR
jgi:hypothetical protein